MRYQRTLLRAISPQPLLLPPLPMRRRPAILRRALAIRHQRPDVIGILWIDRIDQDGHKDARCRAALGVVLGTVAACVPGFSLNRGEGFVR